MIEVLKQALEALEFDSFYGTKKSEAITSLHQAIAELESQEPDELKHIDEQDCLLDVDKKAWHSLVENRGGCRCHISPPCGACSSPISEEEMNELGYTYNTPPAHPPQRTEQESVADDFFRMIADRNPKPFPSPQRTWVGLMRGVRVEGDKVVISVHYGNDAARQVCGALIEEMNK